MRRLTILFVLLMFVLAACAGDPTPEPTEEPVATEEVVEVEATEEVVEVEATEEVVEVEATEEVVEVEATEETAMEATEEAAMDDMEATEEAAMDDMEATEEAAMDDMEATEEAAMDNMEATEEAMMDDMSDMAVASFDDEAGFTFDYPDGYELNASNNAINLDMGDQRVVVVPPVSYSTVLGNSELEGEEQLTFFLERIGYTVNGTAEMMMTAASVNVEVPRRGLVGFANLIDLDNGNLAVVIELAPDADTVPSADGGVISSSMVFFVQQAEEISVGDTVTASITAGNRVPYELTLADGETVNIYLNGIDGLDTYLRVLDEAGSIIAENDDLNGVSSGLEGFSVDGGGLVTVEVGTYADGEAGDYELVVEVAVVEEAAMEATEEAAMEATEEAAMEATEEAAMDDMSDMAVASFDDEAGFTFDYPDGYELNASNNAINLDMGDQRLVVVPPASYGTVLGNSELEGEEQLTFFLERIGYTVNGTAEMMMTAASVNVEVPRRGLVGFANLIDLDNGNLAVVIELAPDADTVPSADGGVISSSMVFFVQQAEEISVGDTVTASITAGNRVPYELTLADGETVNIYLNGIDGLDTYLRVLDEAGSIIAENDDLNGVSSGLEGFSVDGGGLVTVEVGTYADGEAGDYELVVEVAVVEEAAMEATEEAAMDDMDVAMSWTCPEGFEGQTLNIYNWSTYIAEDTVPNFEELCGVTVNYDTYDSDEAMQTRIRQGNPGYDLIVPSGDTVAVMAREGLLIPLNRDAIPNFANLSESLIGAPYDPANEYSVPYQWGTVGIGYNTETLPDGISTWEEVFAYDGPVAWLDDRRAMFGVALIILGYDANTDDASQIEEARQFLQDNGGNVVIIAGDDGQELLARGDVDIAVEYSGDIFALAEECECDTYAYVIPTEAANLWTDNLAIPVDAPNPELAMVFIDYVLDAQVGADISNYTAYASPNQAAIDAGLIDAEYLEDPAIYPSPESAGNLFVIEEAAAEVEQTYNDAWDELLIFVGTGG